MTGSTFDLGLSSSLIVHDFSNKKLKKLYPDLKFLYHFIRNISDLKLKMLFRICGTLLDKKLLIGNSTLRSRKN